MSRQEVKSGTFSDNTAVVAPVDSIIDGASNNSDKSFVVPGNEIWRVYSILATFIADGTAATRQITLEITDESDNIVYQVNTGLSQTASEGRNYVFVDGVPRETLATANQLFSPIPGDFRLGSGYRLRIYNSGSTSGGDVLSLSAQIERYKI